MAAWTARDRIKALLAFREPDRIGLHDGYWEDTLSRWYTEGLPSNASPAERFGFDFDTLFIDSSLRLPERLLEDGPDYTIREDKHGFTAKQWKGRSGALGYLDHVIKTRQDWVRLRHRLDVDFGGTSRIHTVSYFEPFTVYPTWREVALAFRHLRARQRYILLTVYGPFEAIWRRHGFEASLMDMVAAPTFMADMAEAHVDLVIATLTTAREFGIVPDGLFMVEDMGMTTGLLFAPRAYERILFPQHRRLADYLRMNGIHFFMHSDGDLRAILPRIVDSGVQVLQPLEAKANMDVRLLKPEYGQHLAFMGNIDTRRMAGTRAELAEEVRTKLAVVMQGGGYIYHSDHSVPPTVSFANYCYLMELLQEHGRYTSD